MTKAVTARAIGPFIPEGGAFVLARFRDKDKSFKNTSPYKIRDGLKCVLSSRPAEVSALRSGSLLVRTLNREQTEALLAWSSFGGHPIDVKMADRLNETEGMVYAPELTSETPQTILEESKQQGVTSVTRLPSKTSRPSPLLKISFVATQLPLHFYAAYLRYEVRPCYQLPRRCGRCQQYGHLRWRCKRTERCKRCSGDHPSAGCTAQPRCAACLGPHEVTDRECPVWLDKLRAAREGAPKGGPSDSSRFPSSQGGHQPHLSPSASSVLDNSQQEWPELQAPRAGGTSSAVRSAKQSQHAGASSVARSDSTPQRAGTSSVARCDSTPQHAGSHPMQTPLITPSGSDDSNPSLTTPGSDHTADPHCSVPPSGAGPSGGATSGGSVQGQQPQTNMESGQGMECSPPPGADSSQSPTPASAQGSLSRVVESPVPPLRRSHCLDSDDSTSVESSEDEAPEEPLRSPVTPRILQYDSDHGTPVATTIKRRSVRLSQTRASQTNKKNMAYRTGPVSKRAYIPETQTQTE